MPELNVRDNTEQIHRNNLKPIVLGGIILLFGLFAGLGISRFLNNKEVTPQNHSIVIPNGTTTPQGITGDAGLQSELQKMYVKAQDLANGGKNNDPQTKQTITFLAVGDISLSRNVAQQIKNSGNTFAPFEKMKDILASTDFNFGNLETPFSNSNAFSPSNTLVFNAPKKNVEGLKAANFQIVSLANNHSLDQGSTGAEITRTWLSQNNILHMGTGKNLDEAYAPKIIDIKGFKIAFIAASYSSINDSGAVKNNIVARIDDTVRLKKSVTGAKKTADVVVVSMHAGTEYVREPNELQKNFAHSAIDSGADIVIGHHPHWVQTIENYNGKYIFYSLGNFVFDQDWSQDTKEGLVLKISIEGKKPSSQTAPPPPNEPQTGKKTVTLDDLQSTRSLDAAPKITQIELIPTIIERNFRPRPATETEGQTILNKIGQKDKILKQ
ncbi:MAG TPA: CapA family protein [Patescibacteria group bacterium]|nr:CapA family protein [Patescibacteria group bacterium]